MDWLGLVGVVHHGDDEGASFANIVCLIVED